MTITITSTNDAIACRVSRLAPRDAVAYNDSIGDGPDDNHGESEHAMTLNRRKLRWNGWGWMEAPDVLHDKADNVWAWIGKTMGVDPLPSTPAMPLSEIALPTPRRAPGVVERLQQIMDPSRVMTDDYERAFHARGRSYHDLLYLRAGHIDAAPDAVVYPVSEEEVLALVRLAVEKNFALIPFGGGSSVVGGVTACARDSQVGAVTADLTLMDRILEIDETALVARIQAGIYGPALEDGLQARGYTLGHYPQSFEFSTLGGWIAARSAGHQSNKYGKAEHWFVSARIATPRGLWVGEPFPGSAAGPQLKAIVPGSEGILGIITEATVRLHRTPDVKDYRGYVFPSFEAGVEAARELMQSDVPTAMIRLSDLSETFFYNALDTGGVGADAPAVFCLMLVGLEGDKATVGAALEASRAIIKKHGGLHMGESPGEKWYKGRFETPYLRDPLMDHGLGVDTLETATRWSGLLPLYKAVTDAIASAMEATAPTPGARGIVMAHHTDKAPRPSNTTKI